MKSMFVWALAFSATIFSTLATQAFAQERTAMNTWIERPWEISYVLVLEQPRLWKFSKDSVVKNNSDLSKKFFHWEEFFDPIKVVHMPDLRYPAFKSYPEDKAVIVITFDKNGFVTSPNTHQGSLRGRLNEILRIVLSEGDEASDRTFTLGDWFMGLNEDTPLEVAPALCGAGMTKDMPDVLSVKSEFYIYGSKYKREPESYDAFGCREWSYQLQSSRPYIDVTSYVPKPKKGDKTFYKHGAYIGDVVGWGAFGVKKPVIGKHADTWYCLYDCPGDDKPGKIEDIKAWAQRNGWKPPKPPTRMPVFVDDPRKRGTYPE
jgi:hypothetical protein